MAFDFRGSIESYWTPPGPWAILTGTLTGQPVITFDIRPNNIWTNQDVFTAYDPYEPWALPWGAVAGMVIRLSGGDWLIDPDDPSRGILPLPGTITVIQASALLNWATVYRTVPYTLRQGEWARIAVIFYDTMTIGIYKDGVECDYCWTRREISLPPSASFKYVVGGPGPGYWWTPLYEGQPLYYDKTKRFRTSVGTPLNGSLANFSVSYWLSEPTLEKHRKSLAEGASPLLTLTHNESLLEPLFAPPLLGGSPTEVDPVTGQRGVYGISGVATDGAPTITKHPPTYWPALPLIGGHLGGESNEFCDDDLTDKDIISARWIAGDDIIINRIMFELDWNEDVGDFDRRLYYRFPLSMERYGPRPTLTISSKGIRSELNGIAIADARALTISARYSDPPQLLSLEVFYRNHTWEVGDIICITSNFIPNILYGGRKYVDEAFEIVNISYQFAPEGKIILTLLDIQAISLQPLDIPIRTSQGDIYVWDYKTTSEFVQVRWYRHTEIIDDVLETDYVRVQRSIATPEGDVFGEDFVSPTDAVEVRFPLAVNVSDTGSPTEVAFPAADVILIDTSDATGTDFLSIESSVRAIVILETVTVEEALLLNTFSIPTGDFVEDSMDVEEFVVVALSP